MHSAEEYGLDIEIDDEDYIDEDDEWGGKSLREIDLAQYPPLDWRR